MNKFAIIAVGLLLSGCATKDILKLPRPAAVGSTTEIIIDGTTIGKAPPPKVPALPANLAKKAGSLPPLTDPTVAGVQKDGAATDRLYNDVAIQLNNVIDAWSCVMDALNNEKDAKACFTEKAKN